jgi:hypothetical protein
MAEQFNSKEVLFKAGARRRPPHKKKKKKKK